MYIGGMKIKKITHGYVIQTYDMEKERYIEQEFVVGGVGLNMKRERERW